VDNQTKPEAIRLGKTEILISPLGVGTWSWGNRFYWGFGTGEYGEADIQAAYHVSARAGINLFDSAEIYARGLSEKYLGTFAENQPTPPILATKFFPYPWRWRRGDLKRALQGSLHRMGRKQIDLYQIHWPYPPRSIETWVRALGEVAQAGLARAVGVSNYNLEQMTRSAEILADFGVPLASNQVEFSLLERGAERAGLLAACQELDITLIAYSPLASGVLTGKYSPDQPPPGPRGRRFSPDYLQRILPVLDCLHQIGEAYEGKTPAQVALNWVISKGAVPIPGGKTEHQASENAGALGWTLSAADVAELDSLPRIMP
jgi:aryl-alcohol dehydrogenase-like predicted oxidoreductase